MDSLLATCCTVEVCSNTLQSTVRPQQSEVCRDASVMQVLSTSGHYLALALRWSSLLRRIQHPHLILNEPSKDNEEQLTIEPGYSTSSIISNDQTVWMWPCRLDQRNKRVLCVCISNDRVEPSLAYADTTTPQCYRTGQHGKDDLHSKIIL